NVGGLSARRIKDFAGGGIDTDPAGNAVSDPVRGQHLMGEIFTEENRQCACPGQKGNTLRSLFRIDNKLAAVPRLPLGIEIKNNGNDANTLPFKSIEMTFIKTATAITGIMALKLKQAEKEPAVERQPQLLH